MYKITWDKKLNGILLVDGRLENENQFINPPRPVFYEELNLLGFNEFWKYPLVNEPLLWAIGRKYYYKGELVAEARGGNIFERPKVTLTDYGENLKLKPINVKNVIKKNKEALFVLENEALDFVEHTYRVYKKKGYLFAVSYSGGKDSQVVLDIVTRVIPPDDLIVIFSDTDMEIPYTYENVKETRKLYQQRYPGLEFHVARPLKPAVEFWREFGPPSVKQRWCCTVTKTAPFHRLIKNFVVNGNRNNLNSLPKVVVFEGVRSDESLIRSRYERIRRNTKHFYQINAEVIQKWNTTEVFLYLFMRGLNLNKGYRWGLDRIGCSLCPFASAWNEYILYRISRNTVEKFLKILYEYGKSLGLSEKDLTTFITTGQWKKRAGGRGLDTNGTSILFYSEDNFLKVTLRKPRENALEWFKTLGELYYKKEGEHGKTGEIKIRDETLQFIITYDNDTQKIEITTNMDPSTKEMIKKVLYKTTYCVHCGACVEECPTQALSINSKVKINTDLCIHCRNCLNFVDKGCLSAKSLVIYGGEKSMKKDRIATSKFQNFGLRRNWLEFYLQNLQDWFSKTNLGNRQIESLKTWLRESELMKQNKPTITAELLSGILSKNGPFVWGVIWTNLYYNVNLIRWYVDTFDWGIILSKKELVAKLLEDDSSAKEKTADNAISSLLNLFDSSPIGREMKIGIIERRGNTRYVKKIGMEEIDPLVVAYTLYKVAEHTGRRNLTVSELYLRNFPGGPYKLFGLPKERLERMLRGLQEDQHHILRVDLIADLDNIYLRDDVSSLDILKIARRRLDEI